MISHHPHCHHPCLSHHNGLFQESSLDFFSYYPKLHSECSSQWGAVKTSYLHSKAQPISTQKHPGTFYHTKSQNLHYDALSFNSLSPCWTYLPLLSPSFSPLQIPSRLFLEHIWQPCFSEFLHLLFLHMHKWLTPTLLGPLLKKSLVLDEFPEWCWGCGSI